MSASRQSAGRSRVREWAMVTVQSACSSSCATGRPTSTERPSTTARLPDRSPSASRSRIMQPSGVQGRSAGRPLASRPALISVRPSTSLSGIEDVQHRLLVEAAWAGAAAPGCRGWRDRRSASGPCASSSACEVVAPAAGGSPSACPPPAPARPWSAHRSAGPGRRRPAPPPGPAARRVSAIKRGDAGAHLLAQPLGAGLAVDDDRA